MLTEKIVGISIFQSYFFLLNISPNPMLKCKNTGKSEIGNSINRHFIKILTEWKDVFIKLFYFFFSLQSTQTIYYALFSKNP